MNETEKRPEGFVIYRDTCELYRSLPDDKLAFLLRADMDYFMDGIIRTSNDAAINAIAIMRREKIDCDIRRYRHKCMQNTRAAFISHGKDVDGEQTDANGCKRTRTHANESERTQTQANAANRAESIGNHQKRNDLNKRRGGNYPYIGDGKRPPLDPQYTNAEMEKLEIDLTGGSMSQEGRLNDDK